ncbi:MAG: carbon-nitrogen hydrolase family protein [Spirochaetes bacterium]|jgi:predicted amidohydrolase|nr:carbon-nitrogen hydrolase family protein [Spirochaetota bacterium]
MKFKNLAYLFMPLIIFFNCTVYRDLGIYDTSDSVYQLPVALVSMTCDQSSLANREKMSDYIELILSEHSDVRLICFGETNLGWYYKPIEAEKYQRGIAETIDGITVTLMQKKALENNIYISFGFSELEADNIYNSAVIIDNNGEIIAHKHKSEFICLDKWSGFTSGKKELVTTYIDGIKVALLICADYNDQYYVDAIADDEDIKAIILPEATANIKYPVVGIKYWEIDYNRWIIDAMRYGKEGCNMYWGSRIEDPNGNIVIDSGNVEGYIFYAVSICE